MNTKETKTMTDKAGNVIPHQYVKPYDKKRDAVTRKILKRWQAARATLERVHAETLADLNTLATLRSNEGIDIAEKGNMQVSSCDGNITVSLNQRYEIKLDDRVATARDMMFAYARSLIDKIGGEDAKALFEIIKQAFEASRTGNLPIAKITTLLKMNINNPDWLNAKQMIEDSMTPQRGKRYLRVEHRPDRQQDMQGIRLDIADCWQEEGQVESSK